MGPEVRRLPRQAPPGRAGRGRDQRLPLRPRGHGGRSRPPPRTRPSRPSSSSTATSSGGAVDSLGDVVRARRPARLPVVLTARRGEGRPLPPRGRAPPRRDASLRQRHAPAGGAPPAREGRRLRPQPDPRPRRQGAEGPADDAPRRPLAEPLRQHLARREVPPRRRPRSNASASLAPRRARPEVPGGRAAQWAWQCVFPARAPEPRPAHRDDRAATTSTRPPSRRPSRRRSARPASRSPRAATRCATPSPPTSSKAATTSAPSRSCSATGTSRTTMIYTHVLNQAEAAVSGARSMRSDRPPVGLTPAALGRIFVGLSPRPESEVAGRNSRSGREFRTGYPVGRHPAIATILRPIYPRQRPSTTS